MMEGRSTKRDRRVGVACEECRKRKRKCDGLRPTCTGCASSEKDCQYSGTVETRKRKQWDAEYVSSLEDEVATLKKLVADLERTTDQSRLVESEPTSKLFPLPRVWIAEQSSSNSQEEQEQRAQNGILRNSYHDRDQSKTDDDPASNLSSSAIDDLSALVWQMNIGDQGEPAFIGPSGNFCFPSTSVLQQASSEISQKQFLIMENMSTGVHCDIHMMKTLSDLFMSELNLVHQFVPPSFVLILEMYPFEDSSLNLLYNAIFAAGALLSSVLEEQAAGQFFASLVDESAIKAAREHPSALVIQALTILAWRELSQEHKTIAQVYIAMASGLVMSLGLHVIGLEALSKSHSSKIVLETERDTRVRTFWSFFLLDRIATSLLGRNTMVPWRRIDVPPICSLLDDMASTNEVVFSHQCKLWNTHDQFMDQIYSFNFAALQFAHRNRLLLSARAALLTFKQGMPPSIRAPTQSSSLNTPKAVLFLHMSYQTSLLLIHRPYLREPPGSSSFTLALATMSSAATRMTQYIQMFNKNYLQNRSPNSPAPAPSFIIHHILTASIIHLLNGTAQTASLKTFARRKLQICMEVLDSLQIYWPNASKAIAQIQNLAVQWKVVGVLPLRWSFVSKMPDAQDIINTSEPVFSIPKLKAHDDFSDPKGVAATSDLQDHSLQQFSPTASQLEGYLNSDLGNLDPFLDLWSEMSAFDASGNNFNTNIDSQVYADFDSANYDSQLYPELSAIQDVFDIDFSSWPEA